MEDGLLAGGQERAAGSVSRDVGRYLPLLLYEMPKSDMGMRNCNAQVRGMCGKLPALEHTVRLRQTSDDLLRSMENWGVNSPYFDETACHKWTKH